MQQTGQAVQRTRSEVEQLMSNVNDKYQELGKAIDALAGPPGPPGSPKNIYVYEAHRRLEEVAHRAADVYSFVQQVTVESVEEAAAAAAATAGRPA